jgi:predicted CopG family antitoxin
MAFKTVSLDLEAYEILRRAKRPGQSFSDVVKEHVGPKPFTAGDLLRRVQDLARSDALPSDEFLDIMDGVIADRKNQPPRDIVL